MDRETLEFVVSSSQAELYRYVKYLGADAVTAEDVVQDAFLAAYRSSNVPDVNDAGKRGAWLRGIARNIFLNYCRSRRRRMVHEVADPEILEQAERFWASEFISDGDGFSYMEALRGCIEKLKDKTREMVFAFYENRQSRAELAVSFQMSEDGVKSSLRRVRAGLSKCVSTAMNREELDGEPGIP